MDYVDLFQSNTKPGYSPEKALVTLVDKIFGGLRMAVIHASYPFF